MQSTASAPADRFAGKKVSVFNLVNKKGTEVSITNYGAIIRSFKVKMADGQVNDIVLGFDKPEDYLDEVYLKQYPMFGAAVGRYGNRIKNGQMKIDGTFYQLPINIGTDHLHGGITGFDKKIWDVVSFEQEKNKLLLSLKSPDGEEGYPGNLDVLLAFELNENDELIHEYSAVTDKPTAVNLTHHSYFNLNNGQGRVDDHFIKINAAFTLAQDENLTTNGILLPVAGTRFDFRQARRMADAWQNMEGYDQSFVIDRKEKGLALAAEAYSTKSAMKLEVFTTEPVVHFYTGIHIPLVKGKNNTDYAPYSAFCFETQVHPNAINVPSFPNTVLRPGETYPQTTVYRVSGV